MSDEKLELIIQEMGARLKSLELQQQATNTVVSTMVKLLPREQKNQLKFELNSKFRLAITHGASGLLESFEAQKKAVEKVVGRLG
ncbi:hypothetical protein [Klebsiella variicola]|uniref:hypothetical protein n=1 Tax=Klebsiella variicola TaxID=244366 RepID=UPI0035B6A93D